MLPIAIGFMFAGLLLRQRNEAVAGLRARTEELRKQRERNARAGGGGRPCQRCGEFDSYLHEQVSHIAATARLGQERLPSRPTWPSKPSWVSRARGERPWCTCATWSATCATTHQLRPQPVLSQLDRLLGGITQGRRRLRIEGDPRLLPPGVELSGYRIVEHALLALENDPASQVDVVVEFRSDSLQLTVVGPSARGCRSARRVGGSDGACGIARRDSCAARPRCFPKNGGTAPSGRRACVRLGSRPGGPGRAERDEIAAALLVAIAAGILSAGRPSVFGLTGLAQRARFLCLGGGAQPAPNICGGDGGALLALPALMDDATALNNSAVALPGLLAVFLIAYSLGANCRWGLSIIGLISLTVGVNTTSNSFNPLFEMVTIAPWVGGLVVSSRRRLAAELEARALELEEEQEIFAVASVRYERARIARELHDIVAHCISLMVVQAGAGERLMQSNVANATKAFASIAQAATEAEAEIERLGRFPRLRQGHLGLLPGCASWRSSSPGRVLLASW